MSQTFDVVLASNRGPVTFSQTQGSIDYKRGAGGLSGALHPVAKDLGQRATWICAATTPDDRVAMASGLVDKLRDDLGYKLEMLDLDPEMYRAYYDDVSNRMLWFALHDLSEQVGVKQHISEPVRHWEEAYVPVNEAFAEAICRAAAPDARVLVQDYHLSLVPRLVRAARPDVRILHFTHSAFAGPDGLSALSEDIRLDFVSGLAASDVVGFHVPSWCRGFLDAATAIGDVDHGAGTVTSEGHTAWVRSYPIQIDCGSTWQRSLRPTVGRWTERFSKMDAPSVLGRADRLEPSKNIALGFEAFGRLLDRRPELYANVIFVACCYPSRADMPEYQAYRDEVIAAARAVNDRHPDSVTLYLDDDYDRSLGLLAIADVLIVNPWMDGMNLVSKEGVCTSRDGFALILSRRAGSFDELGDEAIAIDDPGSVEETGAAIETALQMDAQERLRRTSTLRERLNDRTPTKWIGAQMDDLERVVRGDEPRGWLLSH